jgi:hypothetical protein
MQTEQFLRKSFPVEAVQVTEENMQEVAAWCNGRIRTEDGKTYIKVFVHNPLKEEQTMAHPGDWVLYAGKGFKIYKDVAFRKTFDKKDEELAGNVFEGADSSAHLAGNSTSGPANPGGTHVLS